MLKYQGRARRICRPGFPFGRGGPRNPRVRIARNSVRTLTPTGTSNAYAIYTGNDQKAFIDGNRVAVNSPVNTAYGFRCNSSNGSLRDNSEWGFTVHTSGCLADGGNVDR